MQYTILICDDDEDILSALEIYLSNEGYQVIKASNGQEAIELVQQLEIHLIVLDVMMPVMDGLQAALEIRKWSNLPIIFLSAKSEDTDMVLGLTIGGDDYITKPFHPIELFARIKASLRRYSSLGGMRERVAQGMYRTGDLVLDDQKKLVTVDGEKVGLTAVEYNILKYLIANLDHVFSSKQIYEHVWNEPAFDVGKIISVHIRHIREKIELNPKKPKYLKVVYGLGYTLEKWL